MINLKTRQQTITKGKLITDFLQYPLSYFYQKKKIFLKTP